MRNKILLYIGGIYNLAFAIFHVLFWNILNWGETLTPLDSLNREIIQILNLCLIAVFIFFGITSILCNLRELGNRVGTLFLFFISTFWFLRFLEHYWFSGFALKSILFSLIFVPGIIIYFYLGSVTYRKLVNRIR